MRWLLCILALCVVAFGVGAQPDPPQKESDEIQLYADFGFQGVVPGDRHGPVRIWVQTQDEDISGQIEFVYSDERGASGRVVAPIDVAAGGLGSVSIVVPLSIWTESIEIVLRSSSGIRLADVRYSSLPGTGQLQFTSPLPASSEVLLSATSRCSAEIIAAEFVKQSVSQQIGAKAAEINSIDMQNKAWRQNFLFSSCIGTDQPPEELPLSIKAYDGVLAIVADSITVQDADPRAISTLHRWVLGGGRLVVLADMPGELWRRLLPPTVPVDSIQLGVQQQIKIPQDIALRASEQESRQLLARPIQLAIPALDAGWQQRWLVGDDALLIEGPAGFGWVTVVSMHPAASGLNENWQVWADVLSTACEAVSMQDSSARAIQVDRSGWYGQRFTKQVPVYVFDAISTAAPIGSSAFVLVAFVTVSLALALGPVDFLILKFLKLRHLAWLSALLWIALASIAGVVMPDRLRAGPSSIARLSVVDQLVVNEALMGGRSHHQNAPIAQLPAGLQSWRLAFTNVFSGSRGSIAIDAAEDGVFWSEYSGFRGAGIVSRPLTVIQEPKSGGLDAVRSSSPVSIRPGVWTSKVFTETGPVHSNIQVSLESTGQGWSAEVTGLGESSRILTGQLRVGERFYSVSPRSLHGEMSVRIELQNILATNRPLENYGDDADSTNDRRYINSMYYERTLERARPPLVQALPGPHERTLACERMLETGRFAMLELFVTDQPTDVELTADNLETHQSTMYRLMIPIEGDPFRD
jgi:hypothetical protein